MRMTAFKKRVDGSLMIDNPVFVDSDNLPESLFLAEPNKTYDENGYEIETPESQPQEPSLEERMRALEAMELERILGGGF